MSQVLPGSLEALVSELRRRRARKAALEHARRVIGRSDLFDAEWYLQRYPDVAKAGHDPLRHFILDGGYEGRSPGPRFDAGWYLRNHADVARSGVNPLVHYLEHGRGEGRSIKTPVPGAGDQDERMPRSGATQGQPTTVPPYISDYDTTWQASPCDWLALAPAAKRTASSQIEDLADPADLLPGLADGATQARIALFLGLGRGTATAAELPNLAQTGLGLDQIADCWFAHARLLLLRMGDDVAGASRVVGFQHGNKGKVHRVTAQCPPGASGLVRLELENGLGPVLLVWQGPDGTPIKSALVLFPSLYRGGVHHAEALAVTSWRGEATSIADYMIELGGELFCRDPLLLGQITVQLRGANGSEPIFQPAIIDGLASHFGATIVAGNDFDGAHSPAERLVRPVRLAAIAERRRSSGEVLLPPDCLPSLASLCSLATSQRVGAASLAIVPQGHSERSVLVCLPQSSPATADMAHPALPQAMPIWRHPMAGSPMHLRQAGLPSAIRVMDRTVWQVDPLVPLSPDVAVPKVADIDSVPPSVSVILSHSGTPEELALSLAAIGSQSGVTVSEIQLLVGQSDMPQLANNDIPIRTLSPAELAQADRHTDVVVLLDTAVFPQDPRTFAILGGLCRAKGVGAATCAVVTSLREEEAEARVTVSWIADCTTEPALAGDHLIAEWVPGATFDVAAGDPRMMAVRREVWDSLWADPAIPEALADMAFALARKAQEEDLATVATTLVRVATSRAELSSPEQSAATPDVFAAEGSRGAATHLIRLMP